MRTTKILIAVAVLIIGATSCNNANSESNEIQDSKVVDTEITLTVTVPTGTRATAPAVGNENVVNWMHVFVSDLSGTIQTNKKLVSGTDFTVTDGVLTTTTPVTTYSGSKYVYVGFNLPDAFANSKTTRNQLLAEWQTNILELADASGNLVMFSTKTTPFTIHKTTDPGYPANNALAMDVKRMVAKIAVEDNLDPTATYPGTIKSLAFTACQSNKRVFPILPADGRDPNWSIGSWVATDFEDISGYMAINAKGVSGDGTTPNGLTKFKYVAENNSEGKENKESTYASVKAIFIPSHFTKENGEQFANPTPAVAADFWAVKTTIAGDINSTPVPVGSVFYFNALATVETFINSTKGLELGAKQIIGTYTGGACYFRAFVNNATDRSVMRNYFYNIRISSLTFPGSPNPGPENPEIDGPETTDVTFTISVLPWEFSPEDHHLD